MRHQNRSSTGEVEAGISEPKCAHRRIRDGSWLPNSEERSAPCRRTERAGCKAKNQEYETVSGADKSSKMRQSNGFSDI